MLQIVASQHESQNVSHVLRVSVLHLVAERHRSHIQTPEVTGDHRQICVMVHLLSNRLLLLTNMKTLQKEIYRTKAETEMVALVALALLCHTSRVTLREMMQLHMGFTQQLQDVTASES